MSRFFSFLGDVFDGMSMVQGSFKYLFAALVFYTFGYLPALMAFKYDSFTTLMVMFGFVTSLTCVAFFYQHVHQELRHYGFGVRYPHDNGYTQRLEKKLAERSKKQQAAAEALEEGYYMIYRDYKRTLLNGTSEDIARAHKTLSRCCKEIDESRSLSGIPTL